MPFLRWCIFAFIGFFELSYCLRIDITSVDLEDIENLQETRCYCNLPACITTGYMCKSEGLGCFSNILAHREVTKARHGCLDLLDIERQSECQNSPGGATTRPSGSGQHQGSLLLCCYQDMCNHVDSPETMNRYNETVLASMSEGRGSPTVRTAKTLPPGYSSQEVWFKAATIAVPICGLLILLILIALAIRILRSDPMEDAVIAAKLRSTNGGYCGPNPNLVHHFHDRHLNEMNTKKVPLLYQHGGGGDSMEVVGGRLGHGARVNKLHEKQHQYHVDEKNQTNAKLNAATVVVIPNETQPSVTPSNNLIDLHKQTDVPVNNCNLYQACPLLIPASMRSPSPTTVTAPASVHNNKLTYKQSLISGWIEKNSDSSEPAV